MKCAWRLGSFLLVLLSATGAYASATVYKWDDENYGAPGGNFQVTSSVPTTWANLFTVTEDGGFSLANVNIFVAANDPATSNVDVYVWAALAGDPGEPPLKPDTSTVLTSALNQSLTPDQWTTIPVSAVQLDKGTGFFVGYVSKDDQVQVTFDTEFDPDVGHSLHSYWDNTGYVWDYWPAGNLRVRVDNDNVPEPTACALLGSFMLAGLLRRRWGRGVR